jgi:hypothetical protein
MNLATDYEYMNATKSEILNILYSLQSHWNLLEEELIEINRDIDHVRECLHKYGEHFKAPLEYLKALKREKKECMKKIIENMNKFETHVQGSRSLLQSLSRQHREYQNLKHKEDHIGSVEPLASDVDTVFVTKSSTIPVQQYRIVTRNTQQGQTQQGD